MIKLYIYIFVWYSITFFEMILGQKMNNLQDYLSDIYMMHYIHYFNILVFLGQ